MLSLWYSVYSLSSEQNVQFCAMPFMFAMQSLGPLLWIVCAQNDDANLEFCGCLLDFDPAQLSGE